MLQGKKMQFNIYNFDSYKSIGVSVFPFQVDVLSQAVSGLS